MQRLRLTSLRQAPTRGLYRFLGEQLACAPTSRRDGRRGFDIPPQACAPAMSVEDGEPFAGREAVVPRRVRLVQVIPDQSVRQHRRRLSVRGETEEEVPVLHLHEKGIVSADSLIVRSPDQHGAENDRLVVKQSAVAQFNSVRGCR